MKIAKQLSERIQESELLIQLYMDYTEGCLTARVVFKYGAHEMKPLQQRELEEQHVILMRDTVREQGILNRLNGSVMERDGEGWRCTDEEGTYEVL